MCFLGENVKRLEALTDILEFDLDLLVWLSFLAFEVFEKLLKLQSKNRCNLSLFADPNPFFDTLTGSNLTCEWSRRSTAW